MEYQKNSFRPQQGLLIMNVGTLNGYLDNYRMFPSPTGVTYYEYSEAYADYESVRVFEFPSPTGVTYYE